MIKPTMYYKNIDSINYKKLKKEGIKCLVFDLDNTLALLDEITPSEKLINTIVALKEEFDVFIVTNSPKKRTEPYKKLLDIEIISFALKPLTKSLRKIIENRFLRRYLKKGLFERGKYYE